MQHRRRRKLFPAPHAQEITALVNDLNGKDWSAACAAIEKLQRWVIANDGKDMSRFVPTVAPLFTYIGGGGIARRWSKMAVDVLVRLGDTALPQLQEALTSPDARLRWACAEIVTSIKPPQPSAVSLLAPLLTDNDSYVRRIVIECLGRLGTAANDAVPQLQTAAIGDEVPTNRLYACEALIKITGETSAYLPTLVAYLDNPDADASQLAVILLGDCGPAAKEAWRSLLKRVQPSRHLHPRMKRSRRWGRFTPMRRR